jgi:hypothetical protein
MFFGSSSLSSPPNSPPQGMLSPSPSPSPFFGLSHGEAETEDESDDDLTSSELRRLQATPEFSKFVEQKAWTRWVLRERSRVGGPKGIHERARGV